MQKLRYIFFLLGIISSHPVLPQGCSDAGFCSLGDLKSKVSESDSLKNNSISIGIGYGQGLEQTRYLNPYLEYGRKLGTSFSLQAKLTASYATGFAGKNFDAGDFFLFGTYRLRSKRNSQWTILAGTKLPLNHSNNINKDGVVLPLDYQSSIGTYDAIAGIHLNVHGKWEFQAGYQLPVFNVNKNTFFPSLFSEEQINKFTATNNFKRKSDALCRVGYVFTIPKTMLRINPNLLGIYHTGNDSYVTMSDQTVKIAQSKGLTLNAGVMGSYEFKNHHQLEGVVAAPVIVREVRPDGLTRSLVITLHYKIQF